jgi:hypothetical protein
VQCDTDLANFDVVYCLFGVPVFLVFVLLLVRSYKPFQFSVLEPVFALASLSWVGGVQAHRYLSLRRLLSEHNDTPEGKRKLTRRGIWLGIRIAARRQQEGRDRLAACLAVVAFLFPGLSASV